MNDKLYDKIAKLLALATSPNEHEARLAAEKANALLIRHNLSAQEIRAHTETAYVENSVPMGCPNLRVEDKYVADIIRKHFFCRPCFVGAKTINGIYQRQILFIGEATNAKVAAFVYEFLFRKFRELWTAYRIANAAPMRARQAYYLGLSDGLDIQLTARRKIIETEMALTVVPDRKLDAHLRSMSKTQQARVPGQLDEDAIRAGVEQGKNLRISRGIEEKTSASGGVRRIGETV